MNDDLQTDERALERERYTLLRTISSALETPMLILGLVWLALFLLELMVGLSPFLEALNYGIWGLFVLDFALEFVIAPRKLQYLRTNWITALSLAAPVLRVLRIGRVLRAARAARAARGTRLLRFIGGMNRGLRALGEILGRRGVGYAAALTVLVVFAGAAGVYALERGVGHEQLQTYGGALWWTAMMITTMGTDYFPRTTEGRLMALMFAVYGFAVFGYITASIASFFVARDVESTAAIPAPPRPSSSPARDPSA